MAVILLARHGQASFGKSDYDVLSGVGEEQASALGRSLAQRGIEPAVVVAGGLRRQQRTAEFAIAAAGWNTEVQIDNRWDEFDHRSLLSAHNPLYRSELLMKVDFVRRRDPAAAFQKVFTEATARWVSGELSGTESYADFTERASGALDGVIELATRGQTALVITSAGTIGAILASQLQAPPAIWTRLTATAVNTGVTKLVHGRRGVNVISINDHSHLEAAGLAITYR